MGELRADMNFRPIRESRADEMGSDLKPLYMKEGAGRNRPAHVAEAVGRLKRPASSGYGLSMTAVRGSQALKPARAPPPAEKKKKKRKKEENSVLLKRPRRRLRTLEKEKLSFFVARAGPLARFCSACLLCRL